MHEKHKEKEETMRKTMNLNAGWRFTGPDGKVSEVNLPHTWNNVDGQDGGNDYWRGICSYERDLEPVVFDRDRERVYLEFCGVNASADVRVNEQAVCSHDGGYATFRADITDFLESEPGKRNHLRVQADNSINDRVYPQKADFTFYGGIYRDVNLVVVNRLHFDMDYYGGKGIKVTPSVFGTNGTVRVETYLNQDEGEVCLEILDAAGIRVAVGSGSDCSMLIPEVHLWDGVRDPYPDLLYTFRADRTDERSEPTTDVYGF